jgi:uncharacterized membrane protein YfcA
VLVYVLGEDVHSATTASLLVVAGAALAGGLARTGADRVCWRVAGAFAAPAVIGGIAGTAANAAVGGEALLGLFSFVMVAAAYATWHKAGDDELPEGETGCPRPRLTRTIPAGLAVGILTGFFGVGGGFVIVPTLALWLHFAIRRAVGTSLIIVSIVSGTALASHVAAGNEVDWSLAGLLTAATATGAVAGAAWATRLPQRVLARVFAVTVSSIAACLLASSLFLGGPPSG